MLWITRQMTTNRTDTLVDEDTSPVHHFVISPQRQAYSKATHFTVRHADLKSLMTLLSNVGFMY